MELRFKDIFDESWALIKSDWAFFILGYSIMVTLGGLAGIFVMAPLTVGFTACIVKRMLHDKAELGDIFTLGFDKFLPSLLVNLLISVISVPSVFIMALGALFIEKHLPVAIALFVIGLLFLFFMVIFSNFAMIVVANEEKPDTIACFKESFIMVTDNFGLVILTIIASIGLNLLGCIPCFMGLMVTAPLAIIMQTVLFAHIKTGTSEPIFVPDSSANV